MRFKAATTLLLALCCSSAPGQSPPQSRVVPVEAELVKPLDIRHLAPGSSVLARVTRDWQALDCVLRSGASLEATVELLERHTGHGDSRLALSFTKAQCGGSEMRPLPMLLTSVARMPKTLQHAPIPLILPGDNAAREPSVDAISGRTSMGPGTWRLDAKAAEHHFPMSAAIKPGDVIDIRGVKLEMGTGPNRSSVFSAKGRDLILEGHTQLLLVPFAMVEPGPDRQEEAPLPVTGPPPRGSQP